MRLEEENLTEYNMLYPGNYLHYTWNSGPTPNTQFDISKKKNRHDRKRSKRIEHAFECWWKRKQNQKYYFTVIRIKYLYAYPRITHFYV